MQNNLYVTNLGYSVDSQALKAHFASCGEVVSASVITERETGRSRGFGFVEMATEAEAQNAINTLNEQPLEGRAVNVSIARARK